MSYPYPKHQTSYKTAKTIKPFKAWLKGAEVTVPVGTTVSNRTIHGFDDNYRFIENCHQFARVATGHDDSTLRFNLEYIGLDVPADYCTPYGVEL